MGQLVPALKTLVETREFMVDLGYAAELGRCLFDRSDDGYFVFRPNDCQIVNVNASAEKMTGLSRRQLLGQNLLALFDADDPALQKELRESCQTTGILHAREGFRVLRDGHGPLHVSIIVSRLATKPSVLGLLTVRDIGAREQLDNSWQTTSAALAEDLEEMVSQRTKELEIAFEELRREGSALREKASRCSARCPSEAPQWSPSFKVQVSSMRTRR